MMYLNSTELNISINLFDLTETYDVFKSKQYRKSWIL